MQTHQTTRHLKKHRWTVPLYIPRAGRLWRSLWMAARVGVCSVAGLLIDDGAAEAQTVSNSAAGATESLPTSTLKKLDAQIVLALKKSRGEPPFDNPTALEPDIPIKDAERVLVDMEAPRSKELLDQIALLGGQVLSGSATDTIVRAMVPLAQVETLAGRADVKSISPARLTFTSVIKAAPTGVKIGP